MKKLLILLLLLFTLTACNSTVKGTLSLIEGIDTVEINTQWDDAGALFVAGNFNITVHTEDEVDITQTGLYTLTYSLSYLELSYEVTRYVIVTDQTPPIIKLVSSVDTVHVGSTWEDSGVIITDNSHEQLTFTTEGTVTTSIVGTYEIIYTASDSSGNTISISRFVHVTN